jgi:hypothetical protein
MIFEMPIETLSKRPCEVTATYWPGRSERIVVSLTDAGGFRGSRSVHRGDDDWEWALRVWAGRTTL